MEDCISEKWSIDPSVYNPFSDPTSQGNNYVDYYIIKSVKRATLALHRAEGEVSIFHWGFWSKMLSLFDIQDNTNAKSTPISLYHTLLKHEGKPLKQLLVKINWRMFIATPGHFINKMGTLREAAKKFFF